MLVEPTHQEDGELKDSQRLEDSPGVRMVLASPLWNRYDQTSLQTVRTIADKARVRRSGPMTAASATKRFVNYRQQLESVSLNTVGAARVVRRHGFRQC